MATIHRTRQNETVDLICWRHYGRRPGAVEMVLEANRGLCEQPSLVLPMGLAVTLPDLPPATLAAPLQKLWD